MMVLERMVLGMGNYQTTGTPRLRYVRAWWWVRCGAQQELIFSRRRRHRRHDAGVWGPDENLNRLRCHLVYWCTHDKSL